MKKTPFVVILLLLMLNFFTGFVSGKTVINEILANPEGNEGGAEWVELYNLEDNPESLKGCVLFLDDKPSTTQKVLFGEEDFIDRYKVVSWDNAWLNNGGDEVKLECPGFSDARSYGGDEPSSAPITKEGISVGRSPDGIGDFYILSSLSPGEKNSYPPTPTVVSSVTPSINFQAATSSPIPSKLPTPMVIVPTGKKPAEEGSLEEGIVLSVESVTSQESDIPTSYPTEEQSREYGGELKVKEVSRKTFYVPVLLVLAGISVVLFSFYPVIRDARKIYNSKHEKQEK